MKTPSYHLDRDFHQVLVAAVHGIAGLESGDVSTSHSQETSLALRLDGYRDPDICRIFAFAQHPHRPRQVDVSLRQHLGDAGVLRVGVR